MQPWSDVVQKKRSDMILPGDPLILEAVGATRQYHEAKNRAVRRSR